MTARADLHVHSKASNRPTEWILRQFGAPESFTEPREVYRLCRERGMDFVTLSDHDTIAGALEIAHLPGTFLSEEVTALFPEDGCEIHCLAVGITEAQHRDIQELRHNVYELRDYLVASDIVHSVAHPLFRVNDMLTLPQLEKLLVLFNRFEALNGIHDRRANDLVRRIFGALTRETIAELAERHRLTPAGPTPWIKSFTGGSDDHGGHYVATTWTETTAGAAPGTAGAGVAGYLAALRGGHHQPGGQTGSSLRLAQSLFSIAHEYYRRQFPLGLGSRRNPFGELLHGLAHGSAGRRRHASSGSGGSSSAATAAPRGGGRAAAQAGDEPAIDRLTFEAANRASQEAANALFDGFLHHARRGRLAESLAAAAGQLAPLALTLAPYLVALQAQHKDADLLEMAAHRFLGMGPEEALAGPRPARGGKKAWFTDTLTDVNGVAKTVRTLAGLARQRLRRLTAITCGEDTPPPDLAVENFQPVATFPIPGYESQTLKLPPLLEVLEHCERERYSEILISTPGPLGLAGLAAAKLLGIPATGIYHTDFPLYVRHLSGSAMLEEMTWTYMRWFFGAMDRVFVASRCYMETLAARGFAVERMALLPRGVDASFFHPGKRDPHFWGRFGINGCFKFLYVGRVSREKNLDGLIASFLAFLDSGRQAQLVVVGDGPYLRELADRHRRPEIVFTGFLHGEDLARAYAGANVFAFPSVTDTFGNVVLEAQAAGLPAIVSDQGGPQEIVLDGGSGLVAAASDPGAFTAAMIRLFDDPTLAGDMSAQAVDNARRHSWERLLDQLFQPAAPAAGAPATPASPATPATPSIIAQDRPHRPAVHSAPDIAPDGPAPELASATRTTIGAWPDRQS
jgi:glycosyltransferase involved in cell wall biosynthesis